MSLSSENVFTYWMTLLLSNMFSDIGCQVFVSKLLCQTLFSERFTILDVKGWFRSFSHVGHQVLFVHQVGRGQNALRENLGSLRDGG